MGDNIVIPLITFLFIFGAVGAYVNETNMFFTKMPESGLALSESQAHNVHEGAMTQPTSEFNWVEILRMFMSVIGSGVLAIFTIIPSLVQFGIPPAMAMILSAPLTFVVILGLWELWLGRTT